MVANNLFLFILFVFVSFLFLAQVAFSHSFFIERQFKTAEESEKKQWILKLYTIRNAAYFSFRARIQKKQIGKQISFYFQISQAYIVALT